MRKQALILALLLTIIITGLSTVGFYRVEKSQNNLTRIDYLQNEKVVIDAAVKNINTQISSNLNDLGFIKDTYLQIISNNKNEAILLDVWLKFSDNKKVYDQIRFIDLSGQEKVRVNYNSLGAYIVSDDALQNKANRNYFIDAINLDKKMFYISNFDLNIENNEVEIPFKPMLRYAQTIYDDQQLLGMIVLNYTANSLIETLYSDMVPSHADAFYLVNDQGEFLINTEDEKLNWSFMFNQNLNFSTLHEEVFNEMKSRGEGEILADGKLYYFSHVIQYDDLEINLNRLDKSQLSLSENWYVISEVDATILPYKTWDNFIDYLFDLHRNTIIYSFILFNSLLIILYLYFINRINKEALTKYDEMTGAYTRLQGLPIAKERFNSMLDNHHVITLIYADLNGLKEINDQYGHAAGDTAIRLFSQAIIQNIRFKKRFYLHEYFFHKFNSRLRKVFQFREDDIFIRLGGDEFLYMCIDVSEKDLDKMINRILSGIESLDVESFQLSASSGKIVINKESNIDFETAINLADHAMYDDKMRYYKKVNKESL